MAAILSRPQCVNERAVAIKQPVFGRDREVNNPLIHLLLTGLSSLRNNFLYITLDYNHNTGLHGIRKYKKLKMYI